MSYHPLTECDEIASALNALEHKLSQGSQPLRRKIGYRGGGGVYTVYWRPHEGFWAAIDPYHKGRHWCVYGTMDPTQETLLTIVCEVNPPVEGIRRQCAGAFLRDASGRIYLAHSGRIGGGRPGIGKEEFVAFYRGTNWQTVRWPDGRITRMIVAGRLDDPQLPAQIAAFVGEVSRFKESCAP